MRGGVLHWIQARERKITDGEAMWRREAMCRNTFGAFYKGVLLRGAADARGCAVAERERCDPGKERCDPERERYV